VGTPPSAKPGAGEKMASSSTMPPAVSANADTAAEDVGKDDGAGSSDSVVPSLAAGRVARPKGLTNLQLKVGMLGDSYVGKTSLMVKYVENKFEEDYIQTLGINFMEKIISLRERTVTFTLFDLGGGENEFNQMIPLVCADSSAILFMFDLTRRATLQSIKEWYRQARGFNQMFIPFLVGTKFDVFSSLSVDKQRDTITRARQFAKLMKAPLVFTSASHSINVQKLFKVVLAKRFNMRCNVPTMSNVGEPLLEY
jgi:Gtp-binding protein of the ras superfamily involved in termination of M-phase